MFTAHAAHRTPLPHAESAEPMFAPRLRFVDVETTGSSPERERITEVGVIAVDFDGDGDGIGGTRFRVTEWSSLVNPGRPIPPEIRWLTGITDQMVRSAPAFGELADELLDRLRDGVLIAHNARFDYGFLRAEFQRTGRTLRVPTLCTVRLSRLLYPERSPHTLDAIVARFGLDGEPRHRALGDARVLWRWLQLLYRRLPRIELEGAIERLLARPSTPSHLAPEVLDEVPAAPGVYLMYGLNAHPIYIGKSIDLKARLASHFADDTRRAADARLAQEVRRIEWHECAGEIDALLREADLVRTRLPAHNVRLRAQRNAVLLELDDAGRPRWLTPDAALMVPAAQRALYGPFASRAAVRKALLALAAEHALCLKTIGLERAARRRMGFNAAAFDPAALASSALDASRVEAETVDRSSVGESNAMSPCFNFQLQRCRGACVGTESRADHAQRLHAALAGRRVAAWPHRGAIALLEHGAARSAWHVADRWCWLGSVGSAQAAAQLAATAPRAFDAATYAILRTALARANGDTGNTGNACARSGLEIIDL